jgi:hypothetical protein
MVSLLISLPKKLWDPKMELKPMAAPNRSLEHQKGSIYWRCNGVVFLARGTDGFQAVSTICT